MLYMDIKKKKASLRDNIKMPLYMYLSLPKSSLSVSDGKAEKYLKIQWTVKSGKWWYFHIEIKAWNGIGRCCGELKASGLCLVLPETGTQRRNVPQVVTGQWQALNSRSKSEFDIDVMVIQSVLQGELATWWMFVDTQTKLHYWYTLALNNWFHSGES